MPHAPQNEYKSIWSFSLSWDLEKNSVDILGDGLTKSDIQEIQVFASEDGMICRHPLTFLVFLVELLDTYYHRIVHTLSKEVILLEKKLGITRGRTGFQGWDWEPKVFRQHTQECYRLSAAPCWSERRLVYLISLCHFLMECLQLLEHEVRNDFPGRKQLMIDNTALAETLGNVLQLANGQLHQNRCLERRLQNLMATVSSIRR